MLILIARSINGSCNNLIHPHFGQAGVCYRRLLPRIPNMTKVKTYLELPKRAADSLDSSDLLDFVKWFGAQNQGSCTCKPKQCVDKFPVELPSARLVSTKFFPDNLKAEDTSVTHMITQFGQFLDHDLVLTPEEKEPVNCCVEEISKNNLQCFPIQIPKNDPFFQSFSLIASGKNKSCLEFTRSVGCCSSGFDSDEHEQFNDLTAFVDASNVYSSSDEEMKGLRLNDESGKLLVDDNNLLPPLPTKKITAGKARKAGEKRLHEMPGLATMHTIFVREHNRIVDSLRSHPNVDKTWTGEDFFQNARRILIAEMQKIVYSDYLPIILGETTMNKFDLFPKHGSIYDESIDPSHVNSFATAAYRFGHSMVQGLHALCHPETIKQSGQYLLANNYFNLTLYEADNGSGMEHILTGLIIQSSQAFDRIFTEEVTNKLFANAASDPGIGHDLVSRNIQRGRDHGLPSYSAFYQHFNESADGKMDCWDKKPEGIDQSNWNLLKEIYIHPHHIDLFVGGLAENQSNGGLTGPTFQHIMAITFQRLKFGDRFFFAHRGNMNFDEHKQIMARTLGDIICDNTNIKKVPENVFRTGGDLISCSERQALEVNKFQIYRVKGANDPSKPKNDFGKSETKRRRYC